MSTMTTELRVTRIPREGNARAHLDTAVEIDEDTGGARVCDPQRVACRANVGSGSIIAMFSTCCGSQTRAPGRGGIVRPEWFAADTLEGATESPAARARPAAPGAGALPGRFWSLCLILLLAAQTIVAGDISPAEQQFQEGVQAYRADDFTRAAEAFQESAGERPAAGTYQNLGNAEWQRGRVGHAILAWEQALWLSPSDPATHNNLQFARAFGQIDAPELGWYEVVSTWMPSGCWALVTTLGLWLVADMLALPGILRRRRTGWQQALAAIGLTLLFLSLPAHVGWHTRSQIGFVLEPNTPLRLTPTETAEEITRVGAGEPGRCERTFGNYYYIRFRNTAGWLTRDDFGLVSAK